MGGEESRMTGQAGNLPWRKRCAHPGCKTQMHRYATTYDTGFCRDHGGLVTGKARIVRAEAYAPPERPGVRVVEVTAVDTSSGPMRGERKRVSLAREPWV